MIILAQCLRLCTACSREAVLTIKVSPLQRPKRTTWQSQLTLMPYMCCCTLDKGQVSNGSQVPLVCVDPLQPVLKTVEKFNCIGCRNIDINLIWFPCSHGIWYEHWKGSKDAPKYRHAHERLHTNNYVTINGKDSRGGYCRCIWTCLRNVGESRLGIINRDADRVRQ